MTLPGLRQVEQDEEGREHRRIAYQPALDGMRGVGVVAMLLWHADVGWIGDGPLFSIEMFFVLSGYLITSLFIVERERTGRIDLRRFWVRRARRLLPALYGLVALVAVWAALPSPWGPNAFETTGLRGDGLSALAYVSNLWFIVGDRAYFGAFGAPSPFLHTWSLSLEEQFYAVLAVVCVLGLRRWAADNGRWVVVAVVGAVLSAVWMAFLARMGALTAEGLWPFGVDPAGLPDWLRTFLNMGGTGDQSRPYFGTFSRMQSVLVGMATAFIARRVDWSAVSQRTIEVLAAVGCGGLAILFLGTPRDLDAIFYGGFLLCDVLTAMAILGLTAPHRPVLWHSLSAKPFVAAGILSYSIYVWHFPLFLILTEERTGIGGWPLDVVRIGVSVAVAYASYRWLEYPIRARGLVTTRRRVAAGVAMVAVVVGFVVVSGSVAPATGGADVAVAKPPNRDIIVVAGDSMAWTLGLDVNLLEGPDGRGPALLPAAKPGCTITPGARLNGDVRRQGDAETCMAWPEEWAQRVRDLDPDVTVVLAWGQEVQDHVLPTPGGGERIVVAPSPEWEAIERAALEQMVDVLSAEGGRVVLLTLPCLDADAADSEHTNTMAIDSARVDAMNALLADVAAAHPDSTSLIDLHGYLCPDGETFRTEIDGVTISVDGVHFSEAGAAKVWEWLLPQVQPYLGD